MTLMGGGGVVVAEMAGTDLRRGKSGVAIGGEDEPALVDIVRTSFGSRRETRYGGEGSEGGESSRVPQMG